MSWISSLADTQKLLLDAPKDGTRAHMSLHMSVTPGGNANGGLAALAPVWSQDHTTNCCTAPGCSETFTLLNRRHHCRNCGQLVCGECSRRKMVIPHHKSEKP